jgi:Flp pilus assembly protein TadD
MAVVALTLCGAKLDPDRAPLTVVEEARTRALLAEALMAEYRWDEALTQLGAVVRLAPTWGFGHTLMAQARLRRGLDLGPTLTTLERALEHSPRSPRALRTLAGLLEELGRQREALEVWVTLTEVSPRDHTSHARLGTLALEIGELALARSHLRIAGGLDSTDGVSRARLAEALELSHDLEAAEVLLRSIASASPNDPWRWEGLYRFLERHGRTRDLPQVKRRFIAARKARAIKRRRMRPLRSPQRK